MDNELDARMASLWRSADQHASGCIFDAALSLDDKQNRYIVRIFRLTFVCLFILSAEVSIHLTGVYQVAFAALSLLVIPLAVFFETVLRPKCYVNDEYRAYCDPPELPRLTAK